MGAHQHLLLLVSPVEPRSDGTMVCPEQDEMSHPGHVCQLPEVGFHPARQKPPDGQKRTEDVS